MTSFTGRKPGASYTELLKLATGTISGSLQQVQDGAGNNTPFSVSTSSFAVAGQGYSVLHTVGNTGATYTLNGNNGNVQYLTLNSATVSFASPTNLQPGASYCLVVQQDGTGGRAVTWDANYKFAGGTDVVITTAASAIDVVSFIALSATVLLCLGSVQNLS